MLRNASVLIIDDEEVMREILQVLLEREGCQVSLAASGEEGLALARSQPFDVAIVDVMMPGLGSIETLDELRKHDEDLPVILITAFASVENAIAAMKRGAFDYLAKPFNNEEALVVVRNAAEQRRLMTVNRTLRESLRAQTYEFSEMIGRSRRMRQVFELIAQAAPSRTTILVEGESGTGKELAARALHANSTRADRPFVTVNSGSLPPDLLESNLFGHVRGAFTGAVAPKQGLFERANEGTIFFDEIGNVPVETQAKLLRVIQERKFMRLGGVDTINVDVRIIAATNVDLERMVADGRFRQDLYYRLHVIKVALPTLRERREDIRLLAQHFLGKDGFENDKLQLDLLEQYNWPGNVRELENAIERAVVLATGTRIDVPLMPDAIRMSQPFQIPQFVMPKERISFPKGISFSEGVSLKEVTAGFETQLIERTLVAAGGVQRRAAEMLQIKPTTLNEMIKRRAIRPQRQRDAVAPRFQS
jgi:two-component system response regulator PilR (NtrC family)